MVLGEAPYRMTTDTLSRTFAALADPTRRQMLERLATSEATVSELAAPFDLTVPTVSRHLKVLEDAGLVSKARAGQKRHCRFERVGLRGVDTWLRKYAEFYEARLDQLVEFVEGVGPDGP